MYVSNFKKPLPIIGKLDIDWILFFPTLCVSVLGLLTMNSFVGNNTYFFKQTIWLIISIISFFVLALFDFRFFRKTNIVVIIFVSALLMLLFLFVTGNVMKGALSWFNLGLLSFQPVEFVKLALIILLSKYFSRRHIEIANIQHIIVSGLYSFFVFILVLFQPDFGSALIILLIWLGMILVSGVSKKHLFIVFALGIVSFSILWGFVLHDYQKQRIVNFLHPLADIRGAGYSAYQSTIAVGSGQILGKGVGYGTQSKLQFLPAYHTDFIFAAYAEEWGFIGVVILFGLFGVILARILFNAYYGATNFEILFGLGLSVLFMSHFIVNVGMNIGIMPVTGITFPFMSYGGTNLFISFSALGILMGMRKYKRATHKDLMENEFLGI
ncbi:MAG: FtsW/RodA/SpoVE family cell cycle protein [Minisyncoccia bacterium]